MRFIREILAEIQWYVVSLLALLAASVWLLNSVSAPVSNSAKPVRVTIPIGSSAGEVASMLSEAGLVRSSTAFVFTLRMRRESERLKPGEYELRPNMSLVQIIRTLVRGRSASASITIPEGYTIPQIARLLAANRIVNERAFLDAALQQAFRFSDMVPVASNSLEGYLFPDTYQFPRRTDCDFVIRGILAVFYDKVQKPLGREIAGSHLDAFLVATPEGDAHGRKLFAVLTLASLVEEEAKTDKDRKLISSVLHNRLRKGMPLQVDATVQYALGGHRRLYNHDYDTPSAYNTYLYKGLPPGPIASPGLKSITAAMRPARSDYLYYVAGKGGAHIFSRTLEEHNRAKAAAQQARQREQAQ